MILMVAHIPNVTGVPTSVGLLPILSCYAGRIPHLGRMQGVTAEAGKECPDRQGYVEIMAPWATYSGYELFFYIPREAKCT